MTIYFYLAGNEYGYMSNFSRHGFELDGQYWLTSEHYFQAQKFITTDPQHANRIRRAQKPRIAAELGRSRKHPLRADWDEVKDDIMRRAVLKKFQTHADIREQLLATGNEELVEQTTSDCYWGIGTMGTGKNMLGIILMEVREILHNE